MIQERRKEFELVKNTLEKYIEDAMCGIFDTRNIAGDEMFTIFEGKYFIIDICYHYSYFEVFGTHKEEFKKLEKYYEELREQEIEKRYAKNDNN